VNVDVNVDVDVDVGVDAVVSALSTTDDVRVLAEPRTPAPSAAAFPTASTSLQRFDAYRLAVAFRRHAPRSSTCWNSSP